MDETIARELLNYEGPDRVISSPDYWELIKNRKPLVRHQTGIVGLDQAIDGFEPGELIVISGPTAMGKTTLCDTIIRNLATESKFALFFTFEVTPEKIVQEHKDPANLLYLPMEHKSMDLRWLKERCWEAALKYPQLSAIFIDHLHYVVDMGSNRNMSLEIGQTMRFLKRDIALALRLPVFLVCHAAKIPLDEEPSIQHLRDSSFVAQEADTVLVVFRRRDKDLGGKPLETLDQGLATIKIEKARRKGTMGRKINVCKMGLKLIESTN